MGNLGATVRSLGPRRALAAAMTLLLLATLGWACHWFRDLPALGWVRRGSAALWSYTSSPFSGPTAWTAGARRPT